MSQAIRTSRHDRRSPPTGNRRRHARRVEPLRGRLRRSAAPSRPRHARRTTQASPRAAGSASGPMVSPTGPDPIDRVPVLDDQVAAMARHRGRRAEGSFDAEARAGRETRVQAAFVRAAGRAAMRTGRPTARATISPISGRIAGQTPSDRSPADGSSATDRGRRAGHTATIGDPSRATARTGPRSSAQVGPRSSAQVGRHSTARADPRSTDPQALGHLDLDPQALARRLRGRARRIRGPDPVRVRASLGPGRPAVSTRRPSSAIVDRRRRWTTSSMKAKSSSRVAVPSRKRSLPNGRRCGCSSSPSAARRSSVSCFTPRASASRSSKSKAARLPRLPDSTATRESPSSSVPAASLHWTRSSPGASSGRSRRSCSPSTRSRIPRTSGRC